MITVALINLFNPLSAGVFFKIYVFYQDLSKLQTTISQEVDRILSIGLWIRASCVERLVP